MSDRRCLLLLAALAALCAFYPALFGERPAPLQSSVLLVPDPREPHSRNDELSDVVTQFVPWSRAVAAAYRRGSLPAWFPANGCGAPLWANPQAQAVTPTTVFFLFLPIAWAAAAGAAVKLLAAAAGTFLFARRRGLGREASLWAAISYGFALHAATWMHFPHTWPVAMLPFTLSALDRTARGESGGFRATWISVLLLLLGGYPETELLAAVFGAAYFAAVAITQPVAPRERLWRLSRAAGASLLALGLTAAYTLPAAYALARSERSAQVSRAQAPPAPLRVGDVVRPPEYWEIARFWVVPEAQGNPRDGDMFGPYSFAGRTSGYAGILVLAFALATFGWRRAPRLVAGARVGALLTVAYVLWYPPLVWLLRWLPGVRDVAARLTTNRACTILILLLALLAACELDRLIRGGRSARTVIACGTVLAALAVVAVEFARAAERPPVTPWRMVSFALPALLLAGAIALLSRTLTLGRARALALLVVAGTALDLLRIGARINPGTRPDEEYPLTPGVRALRDAALGGRFAAADAVLTGMASAYGMQDVRILNPAAPADYEDALKAAAGYTGPLQNVPRVTRLDAPILDFLNVRAHAGYGVVPVRRERPAAILPSRLVGTADAGDLLARLRDSPNPDFVGRAFVVGPDESFPGRAEVLSVVRPRPEEIRVRLRADAPRVLVVPETTDGGWTAESGGARLPVFRANGAFLAVRVPGGESEVVCRYVPPGLRAGAWISAASAAILLGVSGVAAAISRRR